MDSTTDFKLCHKYLYHSSSNRIADAGTYQEFFQMGDGYGSLSATQLTEMELWYDWSHIRDSSEEAIADLAEKLREYEGSL